MGREVDICVGYEQEVSKVSEICKICMVGVATLYTCTINY